MTAPAVTPTAPPSPAPPPVTSSATASRPPTPSATTRSPRIDDTINYRGIVVPDGITQPDPAVLEWFIADADYTLMINNPTAGHRPRRRDRLRRHGLRQRRRSTSRATRPRDDPKVELEVRDRRRTTTSTCPGSWSSRSTSSTCRPTGATGRTVARILSWDAYQRAGVVNHPDVPRPHPAQRRLPGRLQLPGDRTTARGASARATTTTSSSRPRPARSPRAAGQPALHQEGPRRHRLRAARRPSSTASPSPGPPSATYLLAQRRHPAADQLRGRDGHHRAPRLVVEELLPRPGPGHRTAGRCFRGTSTTPSATSAASSTAAS